MTREEILDYIEEVLPGEVEDITLHGYIRHMSDWMKKQGVKIGDEVVFSENSEYDMDIDGKKLLRMRNADILALVENEGK